MRHASTPKSGIQQLLTRYRDMFRIPENQNHYSEEDLRAAERKFLKFALEHHGLEIQENIEK